MPKRNPAKTRVDIEPFEEDEISPEEEATSPEIEDEVAEELEETGLPSIQLTPEDLPDIEGLEVGNSLNATVELTLRNRNDETGIFDFDITDIYSQTEEVGLKEEPEAMGGMPENLAGALG